MLDSVLQLFYAQNKEDKQRWVQTLVTEDDADISQ